MRLTDPDRLFPAEARSRDLARALYQTVADLPIITSRGGAVRTLGDIATVTDAFEEVDDSVTYNGKRSIGLVRFQRNRIADLDIVDILDSADQITRLTRIEFVNRKPPHTEYTDLERLPFAVGSEHINHVAFPYSPLKHP